MPKEYGKLTADQFRGFIDQLPQFREMAKEMKSLLRSTSEEKLREIMKQDFGWCWVYEFPFALQMAIAIHAFNLLDWIQSVAQAGDPQQKLLDDGGDLPSNDFNPEVEPQHAFGLVMSVVRTLESVLLHGRSLSALLQDVEERGDLDSLFKAIKIDRTIVNCTVVSDLIAMAEMRDDRTFFRRLTAALKGPSNKEWAGLAGMKLGFHILRDSELNSLSDDQLEKLMVHTLGVYENVPGARKNLRMHYQNFRKFPTI